MDTYRADIAERPRVSLSVLVGMAVALSANTIAMSVADLPVLRETRVGAQWAFTRWACVSGLALTDTAVACSVPAADLAVVARAIEVVTFAELSADDLLGVGPREAVTDAALAYTTTRADQAVVVLAALRLQCHGGLASAFALTERSDVSVQALAYTAHKVAVEVTLRSIVDNLKATCMLKPHVNRQPRLRSHSRK